MEAVQSRKSSEELVVWLQNDQSPEYKNTCTELVLPAELSRIILAMRASKLGLDYVEVV